MFWVLKYKDLDIYEQIGTKIDGQYYLKTHWKFIMEYKEKRVYKLLTLNGDFEDYTLL